MCQKMYLFLVLFLPQLIFTNALVCKKTNVHCLNGTTYQLCVKNIGGESILVGPVQECPEGKICNDNKIFPCVRGNPKTTTESNPDTRPSKCSEQGRTYPSPVCTEYFVCEKTLWWFTVKKKKCPKNQGFDGTTCVQIDKSLCATDRTTDTPTVVVTTEGHTTISLESSTAVTPPQKCSQKGQTYPSELCTEYYICEKTMWWYNVKKKTCPKKQGFNGTSCVPIGESLCADKKSDTAIASTGTRLTSIDPTRSTTVLLTAASTNEKIGTTAGSFSNGVVTQRTATTAVTSSNKETSSIKETSPIKEITAVTSSNTEIGTTAGSSSSSVATERTATTAVATAVTSSNKDVTTVTSSNKDVTAVTSSNKDVTAVTSSNKEVGTTPGSSSSSVATERTATTAVATAVTSSTKDVTAITSSNKDVTAVTSSNKDVTVVTSSSKEVGTTPGSSSSSVVTERTVSTTVNSSNKDVTAVTSSNKEVGTTPGLSSSSVSTKRTDTTVVPIDTSSDKGVGTTAASSLSSVATQKTKVTTTLPSSVTLSITASSVIPEKTTTQPPVTPPTCTQKGVYPGPRCNQYYECIKVMWWYDVKLKTCKKNQAFNGSLCVPIAETSCSL